MTILEDEYGILIIDNFIVERKYSSENNLIFWHYDHSQRHSVKGIHQLRVVYDILDNRIPVSFDFVYNLPINAL